MDKHIRSVAKGGSIVFAGRLFTQGCRLVLAVFLARVLAAEQYGMYSLGLTVAELVAGLAALGLGTALVRFIPVFRSREDRAALWGTLQLGVGLPFLLSLLLAIALYALANPIAIRLLHEPRMASLLRLISFLVPFLALNDMVAAATRGFRNMHYTTIAQFIVGPLAKLGLVAGIAIFGLNAARALTAAGLAEIVVAGLLLYFLSKQIPLGFIFQPGRRDTKELMRFSLPVYLSSLLNNFGAQLQTLILAAFSNVYNVGIFVLARNVTLIGELFQRSISMPSQPIFSELFAREKKQELARLCQATTRWTFALNLPLSLVALLLPGPILALFGGSFGVGVLVVVILSWRSIAHTATSMCAHVIDMTGHTVLKLVNSVVRIGVSVGLCLLLIPRWGAVGAALAVLIADATEGVLRLIQVFVLFRIVPYDRSFLKPIAAGLIAAAVALAIGPWVPKEPLPVYAAIHIVTIFSVYLAMSLLLGLTPEERGMLADLRRRASALLARS